MSKITNPRIRGQIALGDLNYATVSELFSAEIHTSRPTSISGKMVRSSSWRQVLFSRLIRKRFGSWYIWRRAQAELQVYRR